MRTIDYAGFLEWAAQRRIGLSPTYPDSDQFVFPERDSDDCTRFWCYPENESDYPVFFTKLLSLPDGVREWCAMVRGGLWHSTLDVGPDALSRLAVLEKVGIPTSHRGAVYFSADEQRSLVDVLVAFARTGCCVLHDVHVVPQTGELIIMTDHHQGVWVDFATDERIASFVSQMASAGWSIPDDYPDDTFKGKPRK